jgi:hypothetical protein
MIESCELVLMWLCSPLFIGAPLRHSHRDQNRSLRGWANDATALDVDLGSKRSNRIAERKVPRVWMTVPRVDVVIT